MSFGITISTLVMNAVTTLPKAINEDAAKTFDAAASDGTLSRHETFFLILALTLTVIVGLVFIVMLKFFNAPPGAAANVAPEPQDDEHSDHAGGTDA